MFPILKWLKDGKERTNKEVRNEMIQEFELSKEDLDCTTGKGSNRLQNNVNWALTFLYQAGLLTKPKRGLHKISQSGLAYLAEGITSITEKDLVTRFSDVNPQFFLSSVKKDKDSDTDGKENAQTPEDKIHEAVSVLEEALVTELLEKVKALDPKDFERLVVQLLVKMGYGGSFEDAAKVTQYSHDDGIDGVIKEDVLGLDSIYIQAKRNTTGSVQMPEVQAFVGALSPKHAKKGVFITTSKFSNGAIKYAAAAEASIILVDGRQLCKYMIEYGLGVTTREVIEIKSIDSDYFDF